MKLEKRKRIRSESFEKKKKKRDGVVARFDFQVAGRNWRNRGGKGDRETSRRGSLH